MHNLGLTEIQKQINKKISRTRYKIKRTFGSQKRWFNANFKRYIGLVKTHTQHCTLALCYNLYCKPIVE
jgi:IS5 family transposase